MIWYGGGLRNIVSSWHRVQNITSFTHCSSTWHGVLLQSNQLTADTGCPQLRSASERIRYMYVLFQRQLTSRSLPRAWPVMGSTSSIRVLQVSLEVKIIERAVFAQALSGLHISVNWTFLLGATAEPLRNEYLFKIGAFAPTGAD